MIGSSKLTTFFLLIGIFYWTPFVSGECSTTELTAIGSCITLYGSQFTSNLNTGATCNRTFIPQVCNDYGNIVTCVNNASLSTTTCRPYLVSGIDARLGTLGISCKVNDFVATCTNATQLNQGSGAASFLRSTGGHVIFVAMVTHVILAVFALPAWNS
ncbi:uncharacterized protein LOC112568515 [Pomacea canaliculata]|uniref:uncharacterized protein LOC112568515 n=1 Tax=Pomacea canaliculata TaxID=400727 RepID=UPI000D73EDAF|nr:uncharacterized protein LOC112568515 [Pomacea canaliculata]